MSFKTATENTHLGKPLPAATKPQAVVFAARALWLWVVWTVAYGIYEAWFAGATAMQPLIDQLAPFYPVTPETLQPLMAVGYAVAALSIVWLTVKIADGKRWARNSLLVSFVLQALWVLGQLSDTSEVLSNVPDLGLQAVALWFLYTPPARAWFAQRT